MAPLVFKTSLGIAKVPGGFDSLSSPPRSERRRRQMIGVVFSRLRSADARHGCYRRSALVPRLVGCQRLTPLTVILKQVRVCGGDCWRLCDDPRKVHSSNGNVEVTILNVRVDAIPDTSGAPTIPRESAAGRAMQVGRGNVLSCPDTPARKASSCNSINLPGIPRRARRRDQRAFT